MPMIVFDTMTRSQGSYVLRQVTFPTGLVESIAAVDHLTAYFFGVQARNRIALCFIFLLELLGKNAATY